MVRGMDRLGRAGCDGVGRRGLREREIAAGCIPPLEGGGDVLCYADPGLLTFREGEKLKAYKKVRVLFQSKFKKGLG